MLPKFFVLVFFSAFSCPHFLPYFVPTGFLLFCILLPSVSNFFFLGFPCYEGRPLIAYDSLYNLSKLPDMGHLFKKRSES